VESAALPDRSFLERIRTEASALGPRELLRRVVDGYREHDILTYASAISFQVFFALIPLTLFALGLLGFLNLQEVWTTDLAPEVKKGMSAPAFEVVNTTVTHVLVSKQVFWATFGAAIAVWEVSGAMRAVMTVFDRIYGATRTRSFRERMLLSLRLSVIVTALLLLTVAVVRFGPALVSLVVDDSGVVHVVTFVARWLIAVVLLLVTVALISRMAPSRNRPVEWASFGAVLVVTGWIAMTLVFTWYVTSVADYGSLFGSLAAVIVALEYLYLSAIVFLTGVQVDAIVHDCVENG
jgi:membrane protein